MRAALASMPAAVGPSVEELQAAFPQLEILEYIGRGGMGIVYKARQPHLDRLVALKILTPGLAGDPGFAERFNREARILAKLTHPNLVAVHDFGESGGFYYLLMEYVNGVNLRQAMAAARFTPERALGLIPDLCGALQFAHDHGVHHRDIKPENILLDTKGRVKIADFGIARLAAEDPRDVTLTLTGSALGSTAYMAPEQIEHPDDVDHRADIYSLGVVFYEMLTGGLPLGRFPAPSEKSNSDPRLDEVIFRALEKERERRYQSAGEVKSGVEGYRASPARPVISAPIAATAASGLPKLPPAVVWPLGLVVAGIVSFFLVLMVLPDGYPRVIGLKLLGLFGGEYSLLADHPVLKFLIVLSGFALGTGCLWGIWNLNLMKRGKLPSEGRNWLNAAVVWLPIVLFSLVVFSRTTGWAFWTGTQGDVRLGNAPRELYLWIPFFCVYGVTRILSAVTGVKARVSRLGWISVVLATVSLLGAQLLTRQFRSHWSERGFQPCDYSVVVGDTGLFPEQVRQKIEEAARTAAGPYFDKIRPAFDGTMLRASFVDDPALLELAPLLETSSGTNQMRSSFSIAHVFDQRLRATLPFAISSRLHASNFGRDEWFEAKRGMAAPYLAMVALAVVAAALAGRSRFAIGLIPLVCGLGALGFCRWIPLPALPVDLVGRMISGPQLEEIAKGFSSPRETLNTLIRAAEEKDVKTFRDGFMKTSETAKKTDEDLLVGMKSFKAAALVEQRDIGGGVVLKVRLSDGVVGTMLAKQENSFWKFFD
ncbi:MAG: serine/threonine-protein kinase [Luteolibacter sp.]